MGRYRVVAGTPFGEHVFAEFDTEREAWDYLADKQPLQRLRMTVKPAPTERNPR